jgi:hypothetical protein
MLLLPVVVAALSPHLATLAVALPSLLALALLRLLLQQDC